MLKLIEQPHYEADGIEVKDFEFLLNPEFQAKREAVYEALTPARNATNQLCRGIRWGIFVNDRICWTEKNTYQLNGKFNPEEEGRIRVMDLISRQLLGCPEVERLIREVFATYYPNGDSYLQPYVVQVSAIRYQPTPALACYPSPDRPHQDAFDNAIVVLSRTENMMGGQSRIYNFDETLQYEANLAPGQALFVRDQMWLHQVCPMLHAVDVDSGACYRDIMIVRIDPAER